MKLRLALPDSVAKRLLNGAIWSVVGTVVSQLLLMGTTAAISRMIPQAQFGLYMLVQSTITMLGILSGLGLGTLVTRYAGALKDSNKPRLERILTLGEITVFGFGIVATVALWSTAGWVAIKLFNNPALAELLRLSAAAMLFTTVDNYQKSVLIGFEQLRAVAGISIVGSTGAACLSVMLSYYFGIQGAAAALTVASFVQFALGRFALRRVILQRKLRSYSKEWRSESSLLVVFALPSLVANLLVPAALWLSQLILGRSSGGYVELALFGIAMQWFNALLFVPNIASKVMAPMLAEMTEKKQNADVMLVVKYALAANLTITLLIALVFISLSSVILRAYGQSYVGGAEVLTIIAITAVLASLMNVPGNLLAAQSRMWLGSAMNFGWAVIYVAMTLLLTANGFGAKGLAISLFIAYVAHFTWSTIWMKGAVRNAHS